MNLSHGCSTSTSGSTIISVTDDDGGDIVGLLNAGKLFRLFLHRVRQGPLALSEGDLIGAKRASWTFIKDAEFQALPPCRFKAEIIGLVTLSDLRGYCPGGPFCAYHWTGTYMLARSRKQYEDERGCGLLSEGRQKRSGKSRKK